MWAAIIILVIAIIIAVTYKPKTQSPEPAKSSAPEVLDGRKIRKIYGTVWVDDSMVLAWKQNGTVPIRSKGKK